MGLIEASYVRIVAIAYRGAVVRATPRIVVKVGGAQISTDEGLSQLLTFVRTSSQRSQQLVLVHGGGKDIGRIHNQLGVPFGTESGLRV